MDGVPTARSRKELPELTPVARDRRNTILMNSEHTGSRLYINGTCSDHTGSELIRYDTCSDHTVLRLTAYYAQQRVLCVTRTRVLKAVDEDEEIGNNCQQVED